MTTVVYRDGVLASDTLVIGSEGHRRGYTKKVHRLEDGRLASYAGSFADGLQFIRWLQGDPQTPDFDEFTGIVVHPNGEVDLHDAAYPHRYDAPWFTIGSGSGVARGALERGANAIEAVEAAIEHDISSGGSVAYERLDRQNSLLWPVRLPFPHVNTFLKRFW